MMHEILGVRFRAWAWLAILGAMTLGSSPAAAQAGRGIDLDYQWKQGDSARFRVTEDMVQEVSGEFSTTLEWHREFTYTEKVLESDPETGAATIERTIEGVVVEVEGDGVEAVRYDSADPQTADSKSNPLVSPFAGLEGQVIRFSVDGEGRVTKVEGATDLWGAALKGFGDSALGGALAGAVPSDESMRRQIEAGLKAIPGRAVRVRESWRQEVPHATPIGTMTSESEHTLKGFQRSRGGRVARIETKGEFRMGEGEGGRGALAALAALAGVKVELRSSRISGETLFDVEAGRMIRQEMEIEFEWATMVEGLAGMEELGISGEGHQRMIQRSVLERID